MQYGPEDQYRTHARPAREFEAVVLELAAILRFVIEDVFWWFLAGFMHARASSSVYGLGGYALFPVFDVSGVGASLFGEGRISLIYRVTW